MKVTRVQGPPLYQMELTEQEMQDMTGVFGKFSGGLTTYFWGVLYAACEEAGVAPSDIDLQLSKVRLLPSARRV